MHTEADYQQMSSWGFNVVRLPIAWNFIEPRPGQYDETLFSRYVDRDIAWAKKYGIYAIIDLHQYGWSPYFTYYDYWIDGNAAGVPSWGVSGYPNTSQGEAQAKADFWSNMGPNGTLSSNTNPSMQDRFMQVWKYVAGRYSQEETIAGYDIFNEPMIYSMNGDISYDADKLRSETLPAFYNKAVDTVRTVDNNHMIFWEPGVVNKITSPPDRPNVIYSPHYPGGWITNGYDGNTARLQASLDEWVLVPSQEWNQPAFVGEWGMRVEGANVTQYIVDLANLMDEHLVGAAWWAYAKWNGFGMYLLDEAGNVRSTLVNNLVRPFITSSSASLYSSHFDRDAGQFQADLKGPGVILLHFPSSYPRSFAVKTDIGVSSFLIFQGTITISIAEETSRMTLYLNPSSSLVPTIRTT
jgi:aryl-phospho-beta-D-glucosidase BglC (GH1 family)